MTSSVVRVTARTRSRHSTVVHVCNMGAAWINVCMISAACAKWVHMHNEIAHVQRECNLNVQHDVSACATLRDCNVCKITYWCRKTPMHFTASLTFSCRSNWLGILSIGKASSDHQQRECAWKASRISNASNRQGQSGWNWRKLSWSSKLLRARRIKSGLTQSEVRWKLSGVLSQ